MSDQVGNFEKSGKLASPKPPCFTLPAQGRVTPTHPTYSPSSVSFLEELSSSHKTLLYGSLLSPHGLVLVEEDVMPPNDVESVHGDASLPCSSPPQHDNLLTKAASCSYSSGFEPSPTPSSSLPSLLSPSPSQDLLAACTSGAMAVADRPTQLLVGRTVLIGNTVKRVLRFIRETDFAEGLWIGVELESPCGKNDGSIQGKRYFASAPNYGIFAPPSKVQVLDQLGLSESVREAGVSSDAEEELESTGEQVTSELASAGSLATPDT